MSATSIKIFGNDMALDVKTDFVNLYGVGKSADEINEYILSYQPDDDDEDACAFWSGLALIEWEYGVLTDSIRAKAQHIIENHSDAPLFLKEKDCQARERVLQELIEQLDTVNPAPKKRRKTFVYRTEWKEGDVFAIPLCGKYAYIHVCAVDRTKNKIRELEQDRVFVRVFDTVSDELLEIKDLKPTLFRKIKYKNLDIYRECKAKLLWCVGVREKTAFESKVIHVGNLPTEREITGSVYADFQFCKVENTLIKMFGIDGP